MLFLLRDYQFQSPLFCQKSNQKYIHKNKSSLLSLCKLITTSHYSPKGLTPKSSSRELSMWPCKCFFSHSSLIIYFFPTPLIKFKLGRQKARRLLVATHLDQSLRLANENQGTNGQITFITLFCGRCCCTCFWLCLLLVAANWAKMLGQNYFGKPNCMFWLLFV
jgi:hypothetical protein